MPSKILSICFYVFNVKKANKIMDYCLKVSFSASLPPNSGSDIVDHHNKIVGIALEAERVKRSPNITSQYVFEYVSSA